MPNGTRIARFGTPDGNARSLDPGQGGHHDPRRALGCAGGGERVLAPVRARGRLGSLGRRTPFEEFRVLERVWDALGTSRPEEEGLRRAGTPLPDPWDIPPEAQGVCRVGLVVCGAVVPLSEVRGIGAPAGLDLPIASRRSDAATRRWRTHRLMPAAVLGIGYALVPGAMLESEITRPFRKLERQVESERRRLTGRAGFARAGEMGMRTWFHLEVPAKEAAWLASVS